MLNKQICAILLKVEVAEPNMNNLDFDDMFDLPEEADPVEKRLEVAQYYQTFLQESFFDDDSAAAQMVESEIRGFVRERLNVLMGVKEGSSAGVSFTNQEVEVLKKLAGLGPEASEVLKVAIDRVTQGSRVAAENRKFKSAPVIEKAASAPKFKPKKKQQKQQEEPKEQTKPKYSIDIPEQYKDDPTLKVENNRIFVQLRNPENELLWEKDAEGDIVPVWKEITPPAKPVGVVPLPMPSGTHLNTIMAATASRIVDKVSGVGSEIEKVVGDSLKY